MNREGNENNLRDAFAPQDGEAQDQDDNPEVDEDDEEEDADDNDDNRVLDGGVAGAAIADDSSTAAPRRRAADCDLILYIACDENMDDLVPNHPVLKEGVVVSIGLDKNTKLGAVFSRYIEFCNEHSNNSNSKEKVRVSEREVEFYHCQLLHGNDTAESSALMKNDRIKVRKERSAERESQAELKRIQRETDKEYFKQLRNLMPSWSSQKVCDLVIDCKGTVNDGGRNQAVLSTKVRGHSSLLSKRCKWLASLIETAREERKKQKPVTKDDDKDDDATDDGGSPHSDCIEFPKGNIVANTSSSHPDDNDEDMEDDDEIAVLPLPGPHHNRQHGGPQHRGQFTEIENDDDNDNDSVADSVPPEPSNKRQHPKDERVKDAKEDLGQDANKLWITLPHHSPDAVKILLEYCYTNRVLGLGHDAFVRACKTKPVKSNGPVAPYSSSRRWPNNGIPNVSFAVALAGIKLAEEAGLPRLSLMCEIAASQLVTHANVVEALSMCASQKELTGNDLPRLREVAINATFRYGPRGVYDSTRFREALEERATSIIPTLFNGTHEAMSNLDKQKSESRKRSFAAITESYFEELDREDQIKRDRERRARRLERGADPEVSMDRVIKDEDVYSDSVSSSWAMENARRSLKRMSHNLHVGGIRANRSSGGYGSRDSLGARFLPGVGVRRRTSRRRSSERSS